MERGAFALGVRGISEGDEEAALSAAFALALHDGFEGVDVGAADLIDLLDLNREPVLGEFLKMIGRPFLPRWAASVGLLPTG